MERGRSVLLSLLVVGLLGLVHVQAFLVPPPTRPSLTGKLISQPHDNTWGVVGVRTHPSRRSAATVPSRESSPEGFRKPWTAGIVSWVAKVIIAKYTRAIVGMRIDVGARSNRDVIAGNLPIIKVSLLGHVIWLGRERELLPCQPTLLYHLLV